MHSRTLNQVRLAHSNGPYQSLGCVLGTRECRNDPVARVNGEQHVL